MIIDHDSNLQIYLRLIDRIGSIVVNYEILLSYQMHAHFQLICVQYGVTVILGIQFFTIGTILFSNVIEWFNSGGKYFQKQLMYFNYFPVTSPRNGPSYESTQGCFHIWPMYSFLLVLYCLCCKQYMTQLKFHLPNDC